MPGDTPNNSQSSTLCQESRLRTKGCGWADQGLLQMQLVGIVF